MTTIHHDNHPFQPATSINPSCKQSSLQAITTSTNIHVNQSNLQATNSSLTVAGFGFRTIGRLDEQPIQSTYLNQPSNSSLTVAGFGFRTIGRLVKQPLQATVHFKRSYERGGLERPEQRRGVYEGGCPSRGLSILTRAPIVGDI
ncbi:hypothetical protein N7472_010889 [Penicillium cf. griseofulvum]|uniref:Uncharacterized protein n=1 Tax=Penicillium cf. griseofulvum TaxID=2972120 RepID=A0A9W9IXW5_9EURO|nr:hypothetical protein N7472_010889 [Penicillium cf. griseofulvum]KAJ5437141.1 hypothetical protein N7445_008026 [Penicillium cf. griseofulvum]